MVKSQPRNRFVTSAAALALLFASQLHAQPAPGAEAQVLIGFRQTPGAAEQALVRAFGGTVRHSYTLVPGIAASIPQAAIAGLQQNPLVTVVEPDGLFFAIQETTPWGVNHIGATTVHTAGNTGNGVKICIIDTGMQRDHGDLSSNDLGGKDYVNNDADPIDDNGHGTHVAGTIAAAINSSGVIGVAPDADFLIYKILDANGSGSFSNAIKAVEDCVIAGGKITNNSYGSSSDPGTLVKAAFDNAYNSGVLHVAAAGNSGRMSGMGNTIGYPARYDSVMSVAAVDSNNQRPYWSSYGDQLEISAPGVNILSTYLGNSLATLSGTSMASPHMAGAAALVAIGCNITNPAEIRQRLKDTAQDLGSAGWDKYYGYGLVRVNLASTNCAPADPLTDLSLISVSGPASVVQNVGATINVAVSNAGNQTIASGYSVTLTDDSAFVGTQNVPSLAPGASTTLNFAWSALNTGSRPLAAALSPSDDNSANNGASTTVDVTAPGSASPINLTASGYKAKGLQKADLSWTGASGNVDIYRNDTQRAGNVSGGTYTDNIDAKGAGTYTYKVCSTTDALICSNVVTVVF